MGDATVAEDGTIKLSPELRKKVHLAPGTTLQVSVAPDGTGIFIGLEGDPNVIARYFLDKLADKDLDPNIDVEAATRAARKELFEAYFGKG